MGIATTIGAAASHQVGGFGLLLSAVAGFVLGFGGGAIVCWIERIALDIDDSIQSFAVQVFGSVAVVGIVACLPHQLGVLLLGAHK